MILKEITYNLILIWHKTKSLINDLENTSFFLNYPLIICLTALSFNPHLLRQSYNAYV